MMSSSIDDLASSFIGRVEADHIKLNRGNAQSTCIENSEKMWTTDRSRFLNSKPSD